jgi:hypothetical protein
MLDLVDSAEHPAIIAIMHSSAQKFRADINFNADKLEIVMSARKILLGTTLASAVLVSGCASLPEYEPITPQEPTSSYEATPAPAATYEPVQAAPVESGYEQEAKAELLKAREFANLTRDQYQRMRSAEKALSAGQSKTAYDALQALNSELEVASMVYTVLAGDSLWGISAQEEIYGNPYWWPLIFKKNLDQIRDPDLIYAGQELDIDAHPTIANVNAAVNHAHKRGSWVLGETEERDETFRAY